MSKQARRPACITGWREDEYEVFRTGVKASKRGPVMGEIVTNGDAYRSIPIGPGAVAQHSNYDAAEARLRALWQGTCS